MGDIRVLLLPGLDGTGKLFKRFVAAAPPHLSLTTIALPVEASTYDALADSVERSLPDAEPLVLIAESFSGPLAVALARRHPIAALVFCNSFVVTPRVRALRWLAWRAFFIVPPPRQLLRRYMLGPAADDALVDEVAEAVASVPASVLASRVRSVLDTDMASAFGRLAAPTLYVRGTKDRLVTDAAWRLMAAIRPIVTAHIHGPHLLLQVNPQGAWNAILPFLQSLTAG
jgi:pimeloyl-ACP methyl ester carboxylesterase